MPEEDPDAELGETVVIVRDGYVLGHSSDYKIPYWVCEGVSPAQLRGSEPRKDKFRADPELQDHSRSELADYRGSGYDRGHLAPAGDQTSSAKLKDETFFLSNMAPQLPCFNRQVWRALETKAREWVVEHNGAYILTGPIFYDPAEEDPETADGFIDYSVIGDGEGAVPTHFYKIVVARDEDGELQAIGFVLEHRCHDRGPDGYPFAGWIRSIDWIEEQAGFDFLPELSSSDTNRIERRAASMW